MLDAHIETDTGVDLFSIDGHYFSAINIAIDHSKESLIHLMKPQERRRNDAKIQYSTRIGEAEDQDGAVRNLQRRVGQLLTSCMTTRNSPRQG